MPQKKIVLPSKRRGSTKNHYITKRRKPRLAQIQLLAMIDPDLQMERPTIVFRRKRPPLTYAVPPVVTPLYWFDQKMVDKGYIIGVSDDTFVACGRRFKVLAQDYNYVGSFGYTRWLVWEEAALPKGKRP